MTILQSWILQGDNWLTHQAIDSLALNYSRNLITPRNLLFCNQSCHDNCWMTQKWHSYHSNSFDMIMTPPVYHLLITRLNFCLSLEVCMKLFYVLYIYMYTNTVSLNRMVILWCCRHDVRSAWPYPTSGDISPSQCLPEPLSGPP